MNLSRLFLTIGYSSLSAVMIASEPPNYKTVNKPNNLTYRPLAYRNSEMHIIVTHLVLQTTVYMHVVTLYVEIVR